MREVATYPIVFTWDGVAMVPRNAAAADRIYVIGAEYRLGSIEERSTNSHNHYFAALSDAWDNLPESLSAQFPSVEHLRKFALIKAGFRDERSVVASSKAEALRLSAFIKPMDEYAIVTVSECVVTVYTAKSQSNKAMGKDAFRASKQAVLDVVSDMIGVAKRELQRNAGAAA